MRHADVDALLDALAPALQEPLQATQGDDDLALAQRHFQEFVTRLTCSRSNSGGFDFDTWQFELEEQAEKWRGFEDEAVALHRGDSSAAWRAWASAAVAKGGKAGHRFSRPRPPCASPGVGSHGSASTSDPFAVMEATAAKITSWWDAGPDPEGDFADLADLNATPLHDLPQPVSTDELANASRISPLRLPILMTASTPG